MNCHLVPNACHLRTYPPSPDGPCSKSDRHFHWISVFSILCLNVLVSSPLQNSLGPPFNERYSKTLFLFLQAFIHWSASTSNRGPEPPGSSPCKLVKPPSAFTFCHCWSKTQPNVILLHAFRKCSLHFNLKFCALSSFMCRLTAALSWTIFWSFSYVV